MKSRVTTLFIAVFALIAALSCADSVEPDDGGAGDARSADGGGEADASLEDRAVSDAESSACELDGLWGATFEGTDWGVVNIRFVQDSQTFSAVGNGYDTDEGPFTATLTGTVSAGGFDGEYENDHHWEPGEIDYLGEVDGTCEAERIVGEWRSCTYETAVDNVCPSWMWRGRFQADRLSDRAEIDTEGCIAAVGAMCDVAVICSQELPAVPDIEGDVCTAAIVDRADSIETACTEFLTSGVEIDSFMAAYLNTATTEDIEQCVEGQTCNLEWMGQLLGAYDDYVDTESTEALESLLTPILEDCYSD